MYCFDEIRRFAKEDKTAKMFIDIVHETVAKKKNVLREFVKCCSDDNDIDYSWNCNGREKHAIRLLVYPSNYERMVKEIVHEFITRNKSDYFSYYVQKQIEYINSLNESLFTKKMKEDTIFSIDREETERLMKEFHSEFVSYFRQETDKIIEEMIGE